MRLRFKQNKQKEFLRETKKLENCSWKKLAHSLDINTGTLKNWTKESRLLPQNLFDKIVMQYPKLESYNNEIIERREDNWGQIKGGIKGNATVCSKLKTDPKFRKMWIKNSKKGGRNNIAKGPIKNWEVGFRNIGTRRFIGPRKEKMFTEGERKLAEFFVEKKINYQYEPLIKIDEKNYFPDFIINEKLIIERCGVISSDYFRNLQSKLNHYKKLDKKIVLIFPKKYKNIFYRNVKIPRKFSCIIEDKNFQETAKDLLEIITMGSSSSLV